MALVFLGLGVAIRARDWLHGRCLWADEAMLALNLIQRDFMGLLAPLDRHQMAPLGYLWAVKSLATVTGSGERSLRVVALFAGVAAMIAVWLLTRRVFGSWAAAASCALMALLPGPIYYSNELKPYSSDTLVAATLILVGTRLTRESCWGWPTAVALAVAGSLAVSCSFTAPFTLAGLGLALSLVSWRRADWRGLRMLALVGVTWVAAWTTVLHLATLEPARSYQREYWRDHFLNMSPHSPGELMFAVITSVRAVTTPFGSPTEYWLNGYRFTVLTLAFLAVVGAIALARRREWAMLTLFVAGPAAGLLAAGLQQYPIEDRLWQFAVPAMVGLASGGLAYLDSRGPLKPALVVGAVILIWPLIGALETLRSPAEREDVVTVLHTLSQEAKAGDTVYVWKSSSAQLEYYRRTRPTLWPADVRIVPGPGGVSPSKYLADIGALCRRTRVWLITTHLMPPYRNVIDGLSAQRTVVSVLRATGSELVLLTFPCAPAG